VTYFLIDKKTYISLHSTTAAGFPVWKSANREKGKKVRQIAIYGRGGTGRSTTMQNLTTDFSTIGNKILLVGCGLKEDFIRMLPET
jgi:nitrogenase iron protein NifH